MTEAPKQTETLKLPQIEFPSDLNEEESETLRFLSETALNSIPLSAIGALGADEIFGEKMDSKNESLFLTALVDETEPLQSELAARLSAMFEGNGFITPDRFVLQVFRRKGGFGGKEFMNKQKSIKLGEYTAAICLKDYQLVMFEQKEHLLKSGDISPFFQLAQTSKNYLQIPHVPRNRTKISLGSGRATLKPRDFLSILAWAFWDGYPINEKVPEQNSEHLSSLLDQLKLQEQSEDSEEPAPPEGEEILIYDSQQ